MQSKEAGGYWDKTIDHPNAEEPPAAAEEKAVVSKAKLAQVWVCRGWGLGLKVWGIEIGVLGYIMN